MSDLSISTSTIQSNSTDDEECNSKKEIDIKRIENDRNSPSKIKLDLSNEQSLSAVESYKRYERNFQTPTSGIYGKQTNSLKRSYASSENDFPAFNKYIQKKYPNQSPVTSSQTSNFTPLRARRSLPSKKDSLNLLSASEFPATYPALSDSINRRKSYPFVKSPQTLPVRSYYRSCITDQTPFSPVSSNQRYKRIRTALPYYNSSDLITLKSDGGFIDSHCHLDFLFQRQGYEGSYQEYQKKYKDTFPECYQGCLAIFCNPYSFNKKHLWKTYIEEENVWASFGCHPHNAKDYNDEVEKSLKAALEHPKVRALGEIGLDYSNRNNCLRELQHEAFKRQLKIAINRKLPLVIHCREAHEDGMAIMKEIVPKDYFIHLHCFTDTWEMATKWLEEFPNLYIGLTNVVTFPSASQVHEVAKKIPLRRLLLETDAPYFVPKPLSRAHPETRFSHPGMAIHVAAQVAALKGGVPLEAVLQFTRQNTRKMYKI